MYIHRQPVAKFCKSHTVPARRDCIFIIALHALEMRKTPAPGFGIQY